MRAPDPKQRWLTFVHNHAKVIVACDFFVVITATFRTLYVVVLMEVRTRHILHHNVTAHPTAEWTLQQFRVTLPGDHSYRFVLHDRDSIFSQELDKAVTQLGVRVLRTPGGRRWRMPSAKRCYPGRGARIGTNDRRAGSPGTAAGSTPLSDERSRCDGECRRDPTSINTKT